MGNQTAKELGLQTYKSKYEGKCTFCRKKYHPEDKIVRLTPNLLNQTNRLGLTTKVFKYAHLDCLPLLVEEKYITIIREKAQYLASLTDPEWPEDFRGFNTADASPAIKWLQEGCPRIGAYEIARRLVKYLDTQLGGRDTEENKIIANIGNGGFKGNVEIGGRVEETKGVKEAQKKLSFEPIPKSTVRETRKQGEIFIEMNGDGKLRIHLDPPWENKNHLQVKDIIKKNGAWWDGKGKYWKLSPSVVAEKGSDLFCGQSIGITKEAIQAVNGAIDRRALSQAESIELSGVCTDVENRLKEVLPEGLSLFPFQLAGVAFSEKAQGKILISDEMGLGKTIQAIAYSALHLEDRPILCIVPAIVSTNWENEFKKWLPKETVYRVKTGKDIISTEYKILIITYGLATKLEKILIDFKPKIVILDESHHLKNVKTKRTKAILNIIKSCMPKAILALSGTPVINRPIEFFTTLKLLKPSDFGNWLYYAKKYCNGHQTRFGWEVNGASNTKELSSRLRDLMIRRKKEDVLKELPDKVRVISEVDLTPSMRREYEKAIHQAYLDNDSGAHLAAISAGRQKIGLAKVKAAIEWIEEYHSQGLPVVIFAHHRAVLDALQESCDKKQIMCRTIAGDTSHEVRGKIVEAFQNGQLDVVLISTLAGGMGITLTKASHVLFVERQWTPAAEEQAEDRTHRIGQKRSVIIRYLMVPGTVDEEMAELIEEKRSILHSILDGVKIEGKLDIRKDLIKRWKTRMQNE